MAPKTGGYRSGSERSVLAIPQVTLWYRRHCFKFGLEDKDLRYYEGDLGTTYISYRGSIGAMGKRVLEGM